jgi:hypothetical protein
MTMQRIGRGAEGHVSVTGKQGEESDEVTREHGKGSALVTGDWEEESE